MTSMEPGGFCKLTEYHQNKNKRIRDVSDLQPDDLYTMMLRLGSDTYEAAKKTVRVLQRDQQNGLFLVRLAFMNEELKEEVKANVELSDGIADEIKNVIILSPKSTKLKIEQAYLKDYFGDMYDYMLDESQTVNAW